MVHKFLDYFKKTILRLANSKVTFLQGFTTFLSIILLRSIIEVFSNPFYTGQMYPLLIVFSYASFFIVAFLSFFFVLSYFTNLSFRQIFSLQVICSVCILLAPTLDLMLSGGHILTYTGETGINLLKSFFTIGSHAAGTGFSWGLRIEIIIIFTTCMLLVYTFGKKHKNIFYTVSAALLLYCILFIQGAFVGIINTLVHRADLSGTHAFFMTYQDLARSFFGTHHGWLISTSWDNQKIVESFALVMARFHIISSFILFIFLVKKYCTNTFQWLVSHVAWAKIFCYIGISCFGMYLVNQNFVVDIFSSWVNILGFIMLIMSFSFHGITATVVNDIADYELDKDAHPDRVLQKEIISLKDYKIIGFVSFCFAVITSITINYTVTLFLISLQGLYYIYSVSPFRLKKHWIGSITTYFFIGVNILCIGYFFISSHQKISEIPMHVFSLVGFIVVISSIAKDIKDYEGDYKHNIKTVPVRFGQMPAMGIVLVGIVVSVLLFVRSLHLNKILCIYIIFYLIILTYSLVVIQEFYLHGTSLKYRKYINIWTKLFFVSMAMFITVSLFALSF